MARNANRARRGKPNAKKVAGDAGKALNTVGDIVSIIPIPGFGALGTGLRAAGKGANKAAERLPARRPQAQGPEERAGQKSGGTTLSRPAGQGPTAQGPDGSGAAAAAAPAGGFLGPVSTGSNVGDGAVVAGGASLLAWFSGMVGGGKKRK